IALQWHGQIRYITDLPLAYFYALMVIDPRAWKRIDAADQAIVSQLMRDAFVKIGAQNRKDNAAALIALQKQGIEIVTPSAEQLNDWQQKTRQAGAVYVEKAGISPAMLQRAQALLNDYRRSNGQ
ncbi:MAG TPA: TRAP transporter substrate-binding protein DctP, partial [Pseudomonadales bacterium]